MGRKSRRLHIRLLRCGAVVAVSTFLYRRWKLRSWGTFPASGYTSTTHTNAEHQSDRRAVAPRAARWTQLRCSSIADPFDVVVIGAGLSGLYVAVDAAQRGLRVAVVDAADVGGGNITACMPSVSPGAFPYIQRAIRQRDTAWLRLAATLLEEETTWCNVAPHCTVAPRTIWSWWPRWRRRRQDQEDTSVGVGAEAVPLADTTLSASLAKPASCASTPPPAITTLLPALHRTEMLEYTCAAVISTALSFLCGPLRPNGILSPAAVEKRLPGLARHTATSSPTASPTLRGAVVSNDVALQGSAAAISLARTAEELGVVLLSYAPVEAIREVSAELPSQSGMGATTTRIHPLMAVSVRDTFTTGAANMEKSERSLVGWLDRFWGGAPSDTPQRLDTTTSEEMHTAATTACVYARSVVNCTGCWADVVKSMYDRNALDTVPNVFAGYQAYSYLVAPFTAVHAASVPLSVSKDGEGKGAPAQMHAAPCLSEVTHTSAVHFSSPRISFSSTMVLPWWDRCFLLGPCISPALPPPLPTLAVLHSKDGYAAPAQRVMSALADSGVWVDALGLLSCVSQIVPHVRGEAEVPWVQDLLYRGYALHFSSVPQQVNDDHRQGQGTVAAPPVKGVAVPDNAVPRRDVALLHVYGGAPVFARRIAEEVVDAIVNHQPPLLPSTKALHLHPCRTRHLRLSTVDALSTAAEWAAHDSTERLRSLINETYVERLVDVIARRTHIAYTSPADALAALPSLASIMGDLLHWNETRRKVELEVARRFVHSVAVVL